MVRSTDANPVSSNVAHYIAAASLPSMRLAPCTPAMPPEGHKSHRNFLSIKPERYRKLRRMHRLSPGFVDKNTLAFVRKHIPAGPINVEDVDTETGEQPSIPCEGYEVAYYGAPPLRNLDELGVSWLSTTVLRTVHRVLQMVPGIGKSAKGYNFIIPDLTRDEDSKLFRYFLWEKTLDPNQNEEESPVKMIIAYQPPWILSPRDMEQFASTSTQNLPSYEACLAQDIQYNSACKVWGKLWDICKQNQCYSFVLTNYSQWCFGGFSQAWENGYTTSVKHAATIAAKNPPRINPSNHMVTNARGLGPVGRVTRRTRGGDPRALAAAKNAAVKQAVTAGIVKPKEPPVNKGPSVLEYLLYWIYSAMETSGSFRHPPVLEGVTLSSVQSVDYDSERSTPGAVTPTQSQQNPFVHECPPSESSWNSYTPTIAEPSSGVRLTRNNDNDGHRTHSKKNQYNVPMMPVKLSVDPRNISSWLGYMSIEVPDYLMPTPIPSPPSPTRSEWSDLSFAAHRPDRAQGFFNRETTIEEECESDVLAMDIA